MTQTIDQQNLQSLLASEHALIVDCSATWCGPCKMLHPVVEELAAEYDGRATFGFLDVDDCPDACMDYDITSVPTILYFKNGELVDRTVGALPKSELTAHINSLLA